MVDLSQPLSSEIDTVGSKIYAVADMNLYVLVNLVILGVNIGIFFYQRYDSSKLRRLALKDDFWFRTIAVPIILEPLQEFTITQTRKLRQLKIDKASDSRAHQYYFEEFQSKIHDLIDICFVMRVHSVPLYEDLIKQFEVVEDKIAEYCQDQDNTEVNPSSLFSSTHAEIISIIMKFHDNNKFV